MSPGRARRFNGVPRTGRRPVSGLAGLVRPPSRPDRDSGEKGGPHRLTVAGAAAGWRASIRAVTAFPFHPPRGIRGRHLRARILARPGWGGAGRACYNSRPFDDGRPRRITAGPGALPVPQKLYIRTFGCQMNEYDSDRMADVLAASDGLALTDRPDDADVILFNTCSVREKAQERVFHDLGRVRALKPPARTSSSASAAAWQARRARRSSRARPTSTSCSARRRCTDCPSSSARAAPPAARRSTSGFPRSRSSTICRRRRSTAPRRSSRSWKAAASTARSASCPTRAARRSRGRSTTC